MLAQRHAFSPKTATSFRQEIQFLNWYVYHIILEMSTAEVKPKKLRCEICVRIFEIPEMLSYHMSVEHSQDRRQPTGIS
jgi:hypothetical protein